MKQKPFEPILIELAKHLITIIVEKISKRKTRKK